jgi:hypothetical protein
MLDKSVFRNPFFPQRALNEKKMIAELEKKYFHPNIIDEFYDDQKTPPHTRKARRNQILHALIFLTDLNYHEYERDLYTGKASTDTFFDIAVLGFTSAATLSGGEAAKSILSAIATGLTGTRLAIDKNFFREQATPVLIAKMRASRIEKLNIILGGTDKEIDIYPLERGLLHILEYYNAGTVIVALHDVAKEAAASAKEQEKTTKTIMKEQGIIPNEQSPVPNPTGR